MHVKHGIDNTISMIPCYACVLCTDQSYLLQVIYGLHPTASCIGCPPSGRIKQVYFHNKFNVLFAITNPNNGTVIVPDTTPWVHVTLCIHDILLYVWCFCGQRLNFTSLIWSHTTNICPAWFVIEGHGATLKILPRSMNIYWTVS